MPRIRCRYDNCAHLENGLCGADSTELDPELGCLTFTQESEDLPEEEEWEDEDDLFEEEDADWDDEAEDLDDDEDFDDEDEW